MRSHSLKDGRAARRLVWISRSRVALWVTVLVIMLLYSLWYGSAREFSVLNAETRRELGGSYIELKNGVTHFDIEGPYDGPLFVLVHGGSIPMFVWELQAKTLAAAGFRVLRFDLFGRGYSDRPEADYSLEFTLAQLSELIERFSGGAPVHLAGVSMGGLISAAFTARHPEKVARLTLISPVVRGIPAARGVLGAIVRTPGLGEYAMRVYGMKRLEQRARAMLSRYSANGGRMARQFREQLRFRGYERALLWTLRGDLMRDQSAVYAGLGRTAVPVQALWGEADDEISANDMAILRKAVPDVTFRAVPGSGHGLLMERGELVNEAMIRFHGRGGSGAESAGRGP